MIVHYVMTCRRLWDRSVRHECEFAGEFESMEAFGRFAEFERGRLDLDARIRVQRVLNGSVVGSRPSSSSLPSAAPAGSVFD